MRAIWTLLLLGIVGCGGGKVAQNEACAVYEDLDADGFGNSDVKAFDCDGTSGWPSNGDDCNDNDAATNPGAMEICDPPGLDEDCDGLIDGDDPDAGGNLLAWPDSDGDGYGDGSAGGTALCALLPGWVQDSTDCDDSSAATYPGAAELDGTECMQDADEDGYGSDSPAGGGIPGTDCDDGEPTVFPGAAFNEDPTACMTDGDGDGYGPEAEGGGDCDDGDPAVFPGAAFNEDPTACMTDADGDGYGPEAEGGGDCDDGDPAVFPGAAFNEDPTACMTDGDGDGYGPEAEGGGDCDDSDPDTYLGAPEILLDGVDQDCDGLDSYGWFDDFEGGPPLGANGVWASIQGDALIQTSYTANGSYSLNLSGASGIARTHLIDTTACPLIAWWYEGKRGPESPDLSDSLSVEWSVVGGGWSTVDTWFGDGSTDADFTFRAGEILDIGAYAADFQLRLVSVGTAASDDFFVDDFFIGCPGADLDGDGRYEMNDCDDNDAAHWSDCGVCVDADGDDYGTGCDFGPDCDDGRALVNPGMVEIPGDGLDQNCDGLDSIVMFDDFELGMPDPAVWSQVAGDAQVTSAYVDSGTWSLVLGGSGADVISQTLDTTACGSVMWSFRGKRGPETPDAGDYMRVEYDAGSGWVESYTWDGVGVTDAAFSDQIGIIADPAALWNGFRVRLTSSGSGVGMDEFYVDDFLFGCADDDDGDGVLSTDDCDDNDPAHWSDCGVCVDADGDDYGAGCDFGPDCDDGRALVNPSMVEIPGDGLDQNCDGFDSVVLFDDFELGIPDPFVWSQVSGDALVTAAYVDNGAWAMVLGGAGADVISQTLDATACSSVMWWFRGKRGPETPDAGDYMRVEYDGGAGWVESFTWDGVGVTDAAFSDQIGVISDPAALWSGFRVRLTSSGSGVGMDEFYIDDFLIGCADDDDGDGVLSADDCDDNDAAHWYDCGLCVDADGDDFGTNCDLGWDCDDGDASVHPGAVEIDGDGIDNDCNGFDGSGIVDDFELGAVDPAIWASITGDFSYDTTYVNGGTYSLNMGGGIGIAQSVVFDASACTSVVWSYWGKRGPETPDANEFLSLAFDDGASWIPVDDWEGGATDPGFSQRQGVIVDPTALWNGFRIQFTTNGSGAGTDDFFIDDLLVACGGPDGDGDGVPGGLDCDDTDPAHWSDCGICVDLDGDGVGNLCDLGDDCDDSDPTVYPGALDLTVDGIDQDCNGIDGPITMFDNFEGGAGLWQSITGDAGLVTDYASSGLWSLHLGGGGGNATTLTVSTLGCASVSWGYWGKRGPELPDVGDWLRLEYWDGAAWVITDDWPGGATDPTFVNRTADIVDPLALSATFQMRFTSSGSGIGFDDYFIDDFSIGCGP